jgi:histidine ammonia-lyase
MTVQLEKRSDINLDAVYRVAWRGEDVQITAEALEHIGVCRRAFLRLLDSDQSLIVYGVTTGAGDHASVRLSQEERREHSRLVLGSGVSFGRLLPERVVRAIALARLANFLEGHAAVRPQLAQAVAAMLDGRSLPPVPVQGNGGAGEIVALGHLFGALGAELGLEEKEGMALINGSPCAAALVADVALAARNRVRLAMQVFALSMEAFRAPLEACSPELEDLWDDEHETVALQGLRSLLQDGDPERRWYQAPVSYRILPRVLGHAYRAQAAAEKAAQISLRSVTDNPVFIPPDAAHPLGQAFSTGGYHNAQAYPAIDGLASVWADLCLLAERHTEKIPHEVAALPRERLAVPLDRPRTVGIFGMVQPAYRDEAQRAAQRTFLSHGMAVQNDVVSPTFYAWDKDQVAGTCLDGALAMLAMVAAQALYITGRDATPALRGLMDDVRAIFPPMTVEPRQIGQAAEHLSYAFTRRVYALD